VSEPYTQSLLLYAYQASASDLVKELHARGHPEIRPKHGAVFANIDRGGTRATVLAERAGIGKPAMGELIDDLERLGYVKREADPSDRRAKVVAPTPAALDVTRIVHAFNRRRESSYRRRLGSEAYDTLRNALRLIAPDGPRQPRF
jgi:DNA-binding MarR family transcriptional regulator